MLGSKVSLHDIKDVEAFVVMCLKRSGCNAPPEQWDDLIAEGICLLYTMARNYKPKLDGYESEGKFSGYAVKWLPKQIRQAWHKSQEHHLHTTDKTTGKRGWVHRLSPVSFEVAILAANHQYEGLQEIRMRQVSEFVDVPEWKDDIQS